MVNDWYLYQSYYHCDVIDISNAEVIIYQCYLKNVIIAIKSLLKRLLY